MISKEAIDLIIFFEVSSKAAYNAKYQRPTWPGGASGVTIGIGYDLGYATKSQIRNDWGKYLSLDDIMKLQKVAGVKGSAAKALKPNVIVPWEAAYNVFADTSIPKYEQYAREKLPNFDELSDDCKGALTSLTYNRGPSFNTQGSRYTEMRAIRQHMINKDFDKIPMEIVRMKRLWGKELSGLWTRRDKEAALFEKGLTKPKTKTVVKEQASTKTKSKYGLIGFIAAVVASASAVVYQYGLNILEFVKGLF